MSATVRKAPATDTLRDTLREQLATGARHRLCVAFSGGPDSSALLHALAQLPEARQRGLRALHVDHGMHPDSVHWSQRCAAFCATLGLPFTGLRVRVADTRGEGLEAAARRARYAAFAEHLQPGEWLVLGHHRDDQVETVMLKLLRGAGPEGLGGMRTLRPLAPGELWRPLLATPRSVLRDYLMQHGLDAIDDPANADPRFARNVVRNEVLPLITHHWPRAAASILHAAEQCRIAADHVSQAAHGALAELARDDDTLDVAGWLALGDAVRAPVLDAWLRARGLSAPPDDARTELERQARDAARDRAPRVEWQGSEVHIWDRRLYAGAPLRAVPADWQAKWTGAPLPLPDGCGWLEFVRTGPPTIDPSRFDPPLRVRLRRGGERIRPIDSPHSRQLRTLFQQARVPPWLRTRCPLVYADDELLAVADWWTSESGRREFAAHGGTPRWHHPPATAPAIAVKARRP